MLNSASLTLSVVGRTSLPSSVMSRRPRAEPVMTRMTHLRSRNLFYYLIFFKKMQQVSRIFLELVAFSVKKSADYSRFAFGTLGFLPWLKSLRLSSAHCRPENACGSTALTAFAISDGATVSRLSLC